MIKKILPWFVFVGFFLLIIVGLASRDKLTRYLSNTMVKNTAPRTLNGGAAFVDSAYNYSKNGLAYQITFLEFGAKGCSACKRMESVLEQVKQEYSSSVNVVFCNVTLPVNHDLMKYYGIVAIPTQVLLDQNGREVFRHTGYFSKEELSREIMSIKNK